MLVEPFTIITKENRIFNLRVDTIYEVIGIEADNYRLLSEPDLNDGNKPYLYEKEYFTIIDPSEPYFWKTEFGKDGDKYCYQSEYCRAGFFEDFHNGKNESIELFWKLIRNNYKRTWNQRKKYSM